MRSFGLRERKNVIFERAKFNYQNQHDGEFAKQYVVELHSLARNCNFGALSEELIRDRIESYVSNSHIGFDPDYECH